MPAETLTHGHGNGAGPSEPTYVDVLIVGAGLSGIGAAHTLQERLPGKSFEILEAREAIGGTWDLFRYPGIRSDSDMHTLGYRFRPWTAAKSIADGASILDYVRETARESGVDKKIRFGHKVVKASWSSEEARWTVTAEHGDGETVTITCSFLYNCSGYYRYDEGFTPAFAGIEDFKGTVVHPQQWPEDLDYAGKKVVIIGSGATAVTLVPAMAEEADHVTMLQRSPTYVVSLPGEDAIATTLRRFLPDRVVYPIVRWKNVLIQSVTYKFARRQPKAMKKILRRMLQKALPPGYDVDTHFNPRYNPWDQRLCVVPDGDLFKAIHSDKADIVTDRIERFTPDGIELESGRDLEADVVVSATGLNLLFLGGLKLEIDGSEPDPANMLIYRGMMLQDVPNMVFTIGYTNASWTLKADLVAEFVCRLLKHMDAGGYDTCVAHLTDPSITPEPIMDFNSGYVLRSVAELPKQGSKEPWKLKQDYAVDLRRLRHGSLDDGAMQFEHRVHAGDPVAA